MAMNERPSIAFEPFSEDHQAFRRSVRTFCERELAPHAKAWDDAGAFPRELFRRFGELGFFGIRHDPAWGGSGWTTGTWWPTPRSWCAPGTRA